MKEAISFIGPLTLGFLLGAMAAGGLLGNGINELQDNFFTACTQAEWKLPVCAKQIDDAVKHVKGEDHGN